MLSAEAGVIVKVMLSLVLGVAETIGMHELKLTSVETRIVGEFVRQVPVTALMVEEVIASEDTWPSHQASQNP